MGIGGAANLLGFLLEYEETNPDETGQNSILHRTDRVSERFDALRKPYNPEILRACISDCDKILGRAVGEMDVARYFDAFQLKCRIAVNLPDYAELLF